jgi:hypothetical protein
MIEEKKPAIRKKARETESGACEGAAPSGRDADAALATAVTDAEASLDRAGKDTVVSAHSPDDGTPAKSGSRKVLLSRLAQAAVVALAAGSGWLGAHMVSRGETAVALAPIADATDSLRRGQDDILRLTGDVRALKVAVETLKDGLDRARSESTTNQAQVLERAERGVREIGAQVAQLGEQMQRIEKAVPQPAGVSPELGERLDRLDKALAAFASAKAAAATAPEPLHTASVPAPKPADRDTPIEGWLLHEVYDGLAIVEGRRGQFFEVGRGDTIPGAGRVETIERRAKRWVVVTDRGIITTAR